MWEIPYLNPKAKERVGYPTQKPLILLEQIIKLVTEEGDIVLDPFVGSGTTVVAAKMLKRGYLGIDISQEAVDLTKERLEKLVKTESFLLKKGRASYQKQTEQQVELLKMIGAIPVQRNNGIDGFLKEYIDGKPVSVKIQKQDETLDEAVSKLIKASKTKKCIYMILIRTHVDRINTFDFEKNTEGLILLDSYEMQIHEKIDLREDCAI